MATKLRVKRHSTRLVLLLLPTAHVTAACAAIGYVTRKELVSTHTWHRHQTGLNFSCCIYSLRERTKCQTVDNQCQIVLYTYLFRHPSVRYSITAIIKLIHKLQSAQDDSNHGVRPSVTQCTADKALPSQFCSQSLQTLSSSETRSAEVWCH